MSVDAGTATGADGIVLRIATSDEMDALGRRLAGILRAGDVVVLTGPLGAGKTTLTRGLGEALGVRGPVTSPTFVIARTHPSLVGGPELIHVDAYRLKDALELDDLDLDLEASATVIEWGRGIVGAIADSWLDVEIERPRAQAEEAPVAGVASSPRDDDYAEERDEPRTVTVRPVGARWVATGALDALRG